MRIIHRVSVGSDEKMRRELASLGVVVGEGNELASNLVTFEIDEEHRSWSAIQAWIARTDAVDIVETKFSPEEIEKARWLEPEIGWYHGYPQPKELEFGYLQATYDLTDYCERCGIGLKQKAPFQMKREPKWGSKGILQLNWVFDEYFVTPKVWKEVFEPHGIECRSVLSVSGTKLETVLQLVIGDEVDIVEAGLATEGSCSKCGRTKFVPVTRGPFPALTRDPSAAVEKTKQYFGTGASAFKGIVVTKALADTLLAKKLRGVSFRPVAQLAI